MAYPEKLTEQDKKVYDYLIYVDDHHFAAFYRPHPKYLTPNWQMAECWITAQNLKKLCPDKKVVIYKTTKRIRTHKGKEYYTCADMGKMHLVCKVEIDSKPWWENESIK